MMGYRPQSMERPGNARLVARRPAEGQPLLKMTARRREFPLLPEDRPEPAERIGDTGLVPDLPPQRQVLLQVRDRRFVLRLFPGQRAHHRMRLGTHPGRYLLAIL